MPDSFFHSKNRKRKRADGASGSKLNSKKSGGNGQGPRPKGRGKAPTRTRDEELSDESRFSDEEDENETPAQKRLRLAKLYLDGLKENLGEGEFDAGEIDKELLNARLQRDVLDQEGKVYINIADSLKLSLNLEGEASTSANPKIRLKGHKLPLTHAVCSSDGRWIYTASKDGCIIKWNLNTGRKLATVFKIRPKAQSNSKKGKKKLPSQQDVNGHTDEILALALSDDGHYLASGGRDRRIGVWDVQGDEIKWIKGFKGHRDTISSLAFRKNSHQLYTGSHDRSIKLFDLSPTVMGYVETLFGHQDSIECIDALRRETAVSCGGRDKSIRFWKVVEESQLVFRGGGKSRLREVLEGGLDEDAPDEDDESKRTAKKADTRNYVEGSIDCVAMVDENTFVSGGDSGTLALWITQKKKPVCAVAVAHGLHEHHSETEGVVATPRWITSLACLPYSDLIASGSWEGSIRLWKVGLDSRDRHITLVGKLDAPGVVNSLQLMSRPDERYANWAGAGQVACVAATGGELRSGRWLRVTGSNVGLVYVI